MISYRITSADLVAVTGYSRHKLRSLLHELPGFVADEKAARVAKEYSVQEMILVAICCRLEEKCGLRRDALALLEPEISKLLSTPRESSASAQLAVSLSPLSARYATEMQHGYTGTVLDLMPVFENIERYLMIDREGSRELQQVLNFGPLPIAGSKKDLSASSRGQASRRKHGTG